MELAAVVWIGRVYGTGRPETVAEPDLSDACDVIGDEIGNESIGGFFCLAVERIRDRLANISGIELRPPSLKSGQRGLNSPLIDRRQCGIVVLEKDGALDETAAQNINPLAFGQ